MTLPSTWILTDGKAGDEAPCLGLAERLGLTPEMRRVAPGRPWVWAMPWGPIDPQESPDRPDSPIRPPYPDLLIACGRRSVPYLRHVRRASKGRTLTVMLRDPRTGAGTADIIWVPEHDPLRGDNVIVTATTPHRISPERLEIARRDPPMALADLAASRVAVLLGGDSRHHRFHSDDIERLCIGLETITREGARLMVTASRRTPEALRGRVFALAARTGGFAWDGTGDNPYTSMLALADTIVATADSTNMIGEAAATGTGILVFEPHGGHAKISAFLDGLRQQGVIRPFAGTLESFRYPPQDSTPLVANAIRAALSKRGFMI